MAGRIRGSRFFPKLFSAQAPSFGSPERKIQEGSETCKGSRQLFLATEANTPRGPAVTSLPLAWPSCISLFENKRESALPGQMGLKWPFRCPDVGKTEGHEETETFSKGFGHPGDSGLYI